MELKVSTKKGSNRLVLRNDNDTGAGGKSTVVFEEPNKENNMCGTKVRTNLHDDIFLSFFVDRLSKSTCRNNGTTIADRQFCTSAFYLEGNIKRITTKGNVFLDPSTLRMEGVLSSGAIHKYGHVIGLEDREPTTREVLDFLLSERILKSAVRKISPTSGDGYLVSKEILDELAESNFMYCYDTSPRIMPKRLFLPEYDLLTSEIVTEEDIRNNSGIDADADMTLTFGFFYQSIANENDVRQMYLGSKDRSFERKTFSVNVNGMTDSMSRIFRGIGEGIATENLSEQERKEIRRATARYRK